MAVSGEFAGEKGSVGREKPSKRKKRDPRVKEGDRDFR